MIPKRIAVVGGSTVNGQGDPIGGGFVARLKDWHESNTPETNRVSNLGVVGDTISLMCERAHAEVSRGQTDLLIVYPGLNDTRRTGESSSPPAGDSVIIQHLLVKLVDTCLRFCPLMLMSATPPDEQFTTPYRRWFYLRSDAARMAELVKAIAAERQLPYFDLYERWEDRDDALSFLVDGLHCNAAGHQQLYEELRDFLKQLYC